jgi:O-antigen/teichoic acid export membrane protein
MSSPRVGDTARALFGHGSVYGLVLAGQALAAILVLPALTRTLGPAQFGAVATGMSILLIVAAIATLGLPTVVGWDVYEQGEAGLASARRLAASALLCAVVIAGIAAALFPVWRQALGGSGDSAAPLIACVAVVPQAALAIAQGLLQARRKPGAFAACTLVGVVGAQTVGLALAAAHDTAAWYFAGYALGMTAGAILGWAVNRVNPARLADVARIRAALAHGGPTVVHAMAFIVLASSDRLIIERLIGEEAAGEYHVAYLVGGLALSVLQALNFAWAALVHSADDEVRWRVLADTTAMVERFAAVTVAVIALAAPLTVTILAPEASKEELRAVIAWVAVSAVPTVWYLASVHVLFELKRTRPLAWATPAAAVINIVLNLVLVPDLGLAGSAAATTIAYVVWAAMVTGAARRLHRQPRDLVAATRWAAVAVVAAILGATLPVTGSWVIGRLGLALVAGALGVGLLRAFVTPAGPRVDTATHGIITAPSAAPPGAR